MKLKQKIYLILPNSKHNTNDRFNLLTQHIVDAWHILIHNHYWDKTIATLYEHLKRNDHMQPFRAINQWLAPANKHLPNESHALITIVEWTIQLFSATQINLIKESSEAIQHFNTSSQHNKMLSLSIQQTIRYLLIDCSASLNIHIQAYQTAVNQMHLARQPIQPIAENAIIQRSHHTANTIKRDIEDYIQTIKQTLVNHTPEYYLHQCIQAIESFIERLTTYHNSPYLLTLYHSQLLELTPPPFQLNNLITWLNTYQLETVASEVDNILQSFYRNAHQYLKAHQLQGVPPSPLFNAARLKGEIANYIDYIKTIAGMQTVTAEPLTNHTRHNVTFNTLQHFIQAHTAQYKIALTEYATLQAYSQHLTDQLNRASNQIVALLQDATSMLQHANINTMIHTTLMQRLSQSSDPISQRTTCSSTSSQSAFYSAVKHSASTESFTLSDLFHSPNSARSMRKTESPLGPYYSNGKTI